jgi:hypothetical protein
VSKIKSIQDQAKAANDSVRQKADSGDIDRASAQASFQKNQKALDSALGSVLTDDQKAALTKMGGKHFESTSQDQGFGGPGGPRGFGGPGGGGPGGGGPGGGGPGGDGGPGGGGPGGPPDGGPGGGGPGGGGPGGPPDGGPGGPPPDGGN